MQPELVLSPVQRKAADALLEGISVGGTLVLKGEPGTGKTIILKHIHALRGGALVRVRDFLADFIERRPGTIEEALLRAIEEAMYTSDLVLVDDLHLVTYILDRRNHARRYLLDAALTALLGEARAMKKTLVFASHGEPPWSLARRAFTW